MVKTLYVSDMDGTLLSSDSRVSANSARILSELSADGALITVATARTPATVVPLLSNMRLHGDAIVMTGSATWSFEEDCFQNVRFIPKEQYLLALEFCSANGVQPFIYVMAEDCRTLDVYHGATTMNKSEESFYLERCRLKLKRFHLGTPAPVRAETYAMLMFATGQRANIEAAAEQLRAETACSVSCYPDIFNHKVALLEVLAPGVSKALAIKEMRERLKADRVVVFGDNLNDLPMFSVADEAVAVGNAMPEVKAAATHVIEPNYTDSVARYIAEDYKTGIC